jgi:hypothetical protein
MPDMAFPTSSGQTTESTDPGPLSGAAGLREAQVIHLDPQTRIAD